MNLTRFDSEDLELLINEETGECFASIRATSRMCQNSPSTISRFVAVSGWVLIDAEIETAGGLQGVALLTEEQIFQCFAKYNPELLIQCSKAGVRVYLHTIAGYRIESKSMPRKLPPVRDAIEYVEASKTLQDLTNPIIKSLLEQRLMEELTPTEKLISGGVECATKVILTVRAAELGYKSSQIGTGSNLGKFVLKQGIDPVGKAQHGKYPVNVYDLNEDLDRAIHRYFS